MMARILISLIPKTTLLQATYYILEGSGFLDDIQSELVNLSLIINERLLDTNVE
jgi:hypothetical protein